MHRALQIPEVLLNIFYHLAPSDNLTLTAQKRVDRDLAALARTCRAFKEPALDTLWSELRDPSPLSLCLPEISHEILNKNRYAGTFYSFTRPLEQAEWDVLRSYTCRVRCIRDFDRVLDWRFLRTSVDLTPADPLLPNLRSLHCTLGEEITPFLHLPFPSLIRLEISVRLFPKHVDISMLQDSLRSLVGTAPKIKRLEIRCFSRELEPSKIVSDSICGWSNLQMITCPEICLDVDALIHLSRMPSLAQLTFMLSDTFLERITPSDSPSFSNLNCLTLHASLAPASRLLFWTRLPAITTFTVITRNCPPKHDLASFMASIQIAGMGHTVREFNLEQLHDGLDFPNRKPDSPLLDLNDLWPCMAFHNLRRMNIDLEWDVDLSDDQLLTLGSAWPWLEEFSINTNWGWNSLGGITPNGLALLLGTCPSLMSIALAIDTRGFTTLPARRLRETVHPSSFDGPFSINVVDSPIDSESVPAMAAFFLHIVPHFHFILTSWEGWAPVPGDPNSESDPYRDCWEDVYTHANELIRKRWLNVLRHVLFQRGLQSN